MMQKTLDAPDFIQENAGSTRFAEGNVRQDDGLSDIEPVYNLIGASEKAAMLAFNEEEMIIQIHESTDENAEKYVYLAVNGIGPGPGNIPWVPRGLPVKMKRKYVEVLCRARPVAYGSVERINALGERYIDYPRTSALRYPFSVIEDSNPRGAAWLKSLLSNRS
jgi:hypothetical protein